MMKAKLFATGVVSAVQSREDNQGDEDKEDREHGDMGA